jgi:hypothetical protein
VHLHDTMLADESRTAIHHYGHAGCSALVNIEASLAIAARTFADVTGCLDLPSGYGRVTRLLRRKIPPSRITACDVEAEAVRF